MDPDWWKTLFDETYLITDARTVCDDRLTRLEVDFLEQMLGLERTWPILDLCGGHGRHALELSRRGFSDITVLDYAAPLIEKGRASARKEGLKTRFLQGDARDTGLRQERFRVVIVMASSWGYFVDHGENRKVLSEAFRVLIPGGTLLMDLPNKDYVVKHFKPRSWHEAAEDVFVCRETNLVDDVIYCREVVLSKTDGLIRDADYCTRLYEEEGIKDMLSDVGFRETAVHKNFVSHAKQADYGLMSNRMIVIAGKPL